MALKRLLNDDNVDNFHHGRHSPHLNWCQQDSLDQFTPALPTQSWDQYVDELLGSQDAQCDPLLDGVDIYGSFQETSADIEEWTTGQAQHESTEEQTLAEQEHICYGMIFRAAIRLRGDMADLHRKLNTTASSPVPGHARMIIIKPEAQFVVAFPKGGVVGDVNAQLDGALTSIAEQGYEIDLEVFAPTVVIQETIGRATKDKEAVVRVQINVYGPLTAACDIGKELSQQKIYLQRPVYIRDGSRYENPHILTLPGFQSSTSEIPTITEEPLPDKVGLQTLRSTLQNVYSSLTRDRNLHGLEGDERLNTDLLLHQKTALSFMMQREDGPIPEEYTLWRPSEEDGVQCYRHVLTKGRSMVEHKETGGGILADEMGMGKTLSVLALVLRTLNTAHDWASRIDDLNDATLEISKKRRRSGATLIVASSDLMINEWFQELDKHFDEPTRKALKAIKYHGPHRHVSLEKLMEPDIVITTYHTLASDFARTQHDLRNIEWYRLVIDEAHIIRRQSTILYRTVADIAARSRWCLTGTPIQNRLEDIGSLFAFLRVKPFHSLSNFRKTIAIPFDEGGKRRTIAIERFTRLLDSMCLRRTKDVLHLPAEQHRVRDVPFSPEERLQYEQTKDIMFRAVRNQNGTFDQKSTLGMFQVQLQLRILCNHEDTYFRENGRSSKMEVLMNDLSVDIWNTKSIIFTCWTRTLNLLESYLHYMSNNTWTHERIDGECSTTKRERILHQFTEDPNLRVLIMTTGTGAVGLNLATANRVFIVEPQWNPSVENQAIARALRLGQKQAVLITRYVMKDTVEQVR
ncbi:hypothetical protein J4E89_010312 [Alternaria sp. Ai002NY15]|nr:hypothetical protein J4E89_010312 [Alternaria sp. Ai002NY15]